ncbi:MAG: FtsX-like permease family protein, partial [Bacteroidetes bacterium]|nr:FtsX-like permease family protein [Bacteroidota bacterium]
EVGVRKVAGAIRGQIVFQFLGESILLSLISTILAIGLTMGLIPVLNQFTGKEMVFSFIEQPGLLLAILTMTIIVGVFAGVYPALFISRFKPVRVLKGSKMPGNVFDIFFRKGLVIIQFSLSILLIIATIIIYNQVTFLNNKDLGFDKEYVLTFPMKGKVDQAPEQAKSEFLKLPGVVSGTFGYGFPGDIVAGDNIILAKNDQRMSSNVFIIEHDYIKTMGMEIIAGRDFSRDFSTDENEAFIINETAVREMGFESSEAALGTELHWPMWNHNQELKKGRIIGVVKDFHYKSLHEEVAMAVLHIYPSAAWKMALRVNSTNLSETMKGVEEVWDSYQTGYPLDYQFIDSSFDQMYKAEEKLSTLLGIFTLLSIFVACLGLLGLVAFAAEKRTREIGIRKVLGASVLNIIALITRDFLVLILVSIVIGTPLAWYFMSDWLANFPYTFELNIWIFISAGLGIVLIAILTVGFQAVKAAVADPVESLRYE